MVTPKHSLGLGVLLTTMLVVSCVDVPPRKLDAAAEESAFHDRSLEDPRLARLATPDQPWPPPALALPDLVHVAWLLSPTIEGARARVAAAREDAEAVRKPANPSLTLTPTRVTHTSSPPWVLTATLDQLLDLSGRRRHAAEVADQDVLIADLELYEAAWATYRAVRDAYLDFALDRMMLELARREEVLAADAQAVLEVRFGAGDLPLARVLEGRRRRQEAARRRVSAEAAVARSRAALAAAVHLPDAALEGTSVADGLFAVPEDLEPSLVDRLDLRRGLAAYEKSERELRVELARQVPDLHLGPGFEYDQGARKWSLGVAFELPVLNANRRAIRAAEARREAVRDEFLALQEEAIGEQERARLAVEAASLRLRSIEAGELRTQREREDVARSAFAAGGIGRGELLEIQLDTVGVEDRRLTALRELQQALARWEDALQHPLDFDEREWPWKEDLVR